MDADIKNLALVGISGAVAVGMTNAIANGMRANKRRKKIKRANTLRMW